MKTLLIIFCLFSLKSTAQVRVKGISTLTTKTTTINGVTFKAIGTATIKYFDINKNTIGMPGIQDSVKALFNRISKVESDTVYYLKVLPGEGTITNPINLAAIRKDIEDIKKSIAEILARLPQQ